MNQRDKALRLLLAIKDEYDYNGPIPDWLRWGVVCRHDDMFMCGHRAKYLLRLLGEDV